ncbi:hypothetical protein [Microbacterium deminutum]|uniref:Uncharacterized protein n=1 Tax=Microbacterium deminutum TaxID=344164 RepID=A0ABP5C8A5_9MICO
MLHNIDTASQLERQRIAEFSSAAQLIALQKERAVTEKLPARRRDPAWHRFLTHWHIAPRWVH